MDIMQLNESNDLILENDEEPMNQANLLVSTSQRSCLNLRLLSNLINFAPRVHSPKENLAIKNQRIVPFSFLGLIISCGRYGSTWKEETTELTAFLRRNVHALKQLTLSKIKEKNFITTGLNNWKDATCIFEQHRKSVCHKEAVMKWDQRYQY